MGCNFYTVTGKHIGKRSAAGLYCWDCHVTLCIGGEKNVHTSDSRWHKRCPKCHKKPESESLHGGAVGRELGFNKEPFAPKKGVASCSSFSWDVDPDSIKRLRIIEDEYGRRYTAKEFQELLSECPIRRTDHIGMDFS